MLARISSIRMFILGAALLGCLISNAIPQTGAKARPPQMDGRRFESAETCMQCHADHYSEWKGSMMHYSAISPVFQAFELKVRETTGRFGVHDRQDPTFCVNCHSPTASYRNEMVGVTQSEPAIHGMGKVAREGISCTFCHSVKKPGHYEDRDKGMLGDSLANADLIFFPNTQLVGPTTKEPLPKAEGYHSDGFWPDRKSSQFLTSSEFCGSCHNVHIPNTPDSVTGEPYQVEQSTFNEWKKSPYSGANNPHGQAISCTDCHMSLYGTTDGATKLPHPPGVYPVAQVAKGYPIKRKHAIHSFTAASTALIEDEEFPTHQQKPLREQMLRIACSLGFGETPTQLDPSQSLVPVELVIQNTGAGHAVPTGLGQEREVWVELEVVSSKGKTLFKSGALVDTAHPETGESKPDGRIHDEDLTDLTIQLDPRTVELKQARIGKDFNLRPFADWGTPRFSNAFMREKKTGDYEHVYFFSLASHMDNDRALQPLQPVKVKYQLPVANLLPANGDCDVVTVKARLLYRSFRPNLLRTLAISKPNLLQESHVDKNEIVEMQRASRQVSLCRRKGDAFDPVSVENQQFAFCRNGQKWLGNYRPVDWQTAKERCSQLGCALASPEQYDSLGLAAYQPIPGDNKDELWKDRWTAHQPVDGEATTYRFSAGENRLGKRNIGPASLEALPYFCICESKSKGECQ
jgi:hypothetical protein